MPPDRTLMNSTTPHNTHNTKHSIRGLLVQLLEPKSRFIMDDRRASTSSDLGAADEEEDHIRVICR